MGDELRLFIPITKIDEEKRLVYGRITDESVDKAGEAWDYELSKPYWEAWSAEIEKATEGKSVGNLRSMHSSKVAGKLTELVFDDAAKAIDCVAKVLDDAEWLLCMEGAYTGFSQGGRYVKRWKNDAGVSRFASSPVEVSLVDSPMLGSARFQLVKADGLVEERSFKEPAKAAPSTEQPEAEPNTPKPNTEDEEEAYVKRAAALGIDHSPMAVRDLIREHSARIGQGVK